MGLAARHRVLREVSQAMFLVSEFEAARTAKRKVGLDSIN
jgi:hypothetical protein